MGRGSYYGGQLVRPDELDEMSRDIQSDPEYQRLTDRLGGAYVPWTLPGLMEHVSCDFFARRAMCVVLVRAMPDLVVRHPGGYGYLARSPMRPRERYEVAPFSLASVQHVVEQRHSWEGGSNRSFPSYGPGYDRWAVQGGQCVDGRVWVHAERAAWAGHVVASEPEALRFAYRVLRDGTGFSAVYDSAERLGGRAGAVWALLLRARQDGNEHIASILEKLQDRIGF